ncbi:bifunctional 4-hydroxy-2-oxoglutarate aldolase/2-dehydro-3-deoxy-phosphogluconate aldolase [Aeromonas cavernicola]|uniref:bifunctional 4-hydroxy-2-oxoglutarate aldolase/2-dehydro-3-deoxy-phosphogluconate aldolase n=1 Tax=Aeromonas cavernicola TaxID=1006623 RepID=UPI001F17AD64|nr:bifunctional 4-hydroxy-2-oxoglutarate aldolase/2-dehydro-3-deoxy-phosphogluconate aldolase [Aeromonas cavernicola]
MDLIEKIAALKIIPVIALEQPEAILPLGNALADNGLPVAEITFRSAAAVEAIKLLRTARPDMLIGAGTVLNGEQVKAAKDAGADFIVSPGFNPNTVRACQALNIPIIPGVNNPSAIESALEMGLTTLKFFPAHASGGVAMIKALLAPYHQVRFMPTGGITPSNVRDYLAISGVIACGGSWMVDKTLISDQRWDEIGRLTREAVALATVA